MPRRLKTGSRYDTGSVSAVSIAKVVGETTFSPIKFNSWCQIFGQSDWLNAD